jgi:peptide chain release factor 2
VGVVKNTRIAVAGKPARNKERMHLIDTVELRQSIEAMRLSLRETADAFDIDGMRAELDELRKKQEEPEFWNDIEGSQKINKRIKALEVRINTYNSLVARVDDAEVLIELGEEAGDEDSLNEAQEEVEKLEEKVEELRLSALLNGEYDANNAILSLHAGAGGTEAQDWTGMLYRMYTRYCENKGYSIKVLDYLEGDDAGIKSVTFEVAGDMAYGYLKAEKGVHRLVRISPFDSSSRRHTSFASLDVMPDIDDDIEIDINQDELRIDTYRSSGAGGQHVNKTDSAIRITHLPTGIVVQCQNERSQMQNRETAMRMLKSKLLEIKEREAMEKVLEIKGEMKRIEWGSQIRSYVFHPYSMVKDHRTGEETGNVQAVMDGEIDVFINSYLRKS